MQPKYYETKLKWKTSRRGELSIKGTAAIEVTDMKFMNDEPNKWSAEDLFVASVNASYMSSFLQEANNSRIPVLSYESRAIGVTEKILTQLVLSEIIIEPRILILNSADGTSVLHLIQTAIEKCVVAVSIKTKIIVQPTIDYKIMEEII